jgi:hypothetical protein
MTAMLSFHVSQDNLNIFPNITTTYVTATVATQGNIATKMQAYIVSLPVPLSAKTRTVLSPLMKMPKYYTNRTTHQLVVYQSPYHRLCATEAVK